MHFAFEALRPDGSTVTDRIEAGDRDAAADILRDRGLMVTHIEDARGGTTGSSASPNAGKVSLRELVILTRQLKMLLESGSSLVPALEAAEKQSNRPGIRALLRRLHDRVEGGDNLSQALEPEGRYFDPVFRSLVAAGESTGSLPQVFDRLAALGQQQLQTRKMVIGAVTYPAILCLLLIGVMAILLLFVIPRFTILFTSLNSPLPATTKFLFELSEFVRVGWPYILGGAALVITGLVFAVRLPATKAWFDELLIRLPIVGKLMARLVFARVVRIWAAMLRCHIPLLEAIQQSRAAVTNVTFLRLLNDVEQSVSSGGHMGQAIARARLADPVIVSAISTGEENGRLAEATDFVSNWMDEDNTAMVQAVTRLAEPLLLAFMGLIVGFVAMSLFIPLFDLATAGA